MSHPGPSATEPSYRSDDPGTWHRVHPVSPVVRGWIAVAAVLVVFGRNWFEQTATSISRGGPRGNGDLPVVTVLAIGGGAVLVFGVLFFLSWFFTRYQVTEEHVRLNSGVLFRQHRQARIDRVQAVDLVQPFLARIFGLAELRFEVADAGHSAMKLSFLRLDEAQRLRATILARAAGGRSPIGNRDGVGTLPGGTASPESESPAVVLEAPEQPILQLSGGRILGATVLSGLSVATIAALAVLLWLGVAGHIGAVVVLLPGFLGLAAGYWTYFSNHFNFRVGWSPNGIRLHYGLLETRSQSIPAGRVQALGVTQPLLWRPVGWYRVHVNVAGYGRDSREHGNRSVLLPAATLAEVLSILPLVLPDPGVDEPSAVFTAGIAGSGSEYGFLHSPRRARLLDPLAWRRNAYRATRTALLCRHGAFRRAFQVVPHERTQSLSLFQGPLMRRLNLANFELHSTPGPVVPVVRHLDAGVARSLFDEQASRAAKARRSAAPERRQEQPEVSDE